MGFLGMRGTGDWVPNQRELSWREMILRLYPNGRAPLTAMLSKMKKTPLDDPTFNWWAKIFSAVQGPVTATTLTTTATIGTEFTVTLGTRSEAAASGAMPPLAIPPGKPGAKQEQPESILGGVTSPNRMDRPAGSERTNIESYMTLIRPGHQMLLLSNGNAPFSLNAKVISLAAGATANTTVVTLRALEAPSGLGTSDTVDYFMIVGNINTEGGEMPDAISTDPVQIWNNTQIFRTPLSITRTARKTRLRTPEQYQESKMECLEMHSVEMELAFLFGVQSVRLGANNQPERTTMGWENFTKKFAPNNVFDATAAANPSGLTQRPGGWTAESNGITNGERFLDDVFEYILRYGGSDRTILCGNGVVRGLNDIPKVAGTIQIAPKQQTYGMRVMDWVTPYGNFNLLTHPLFNANPRLRNTAFIMDTQSLEFRYIDDTTFFGESGKTRAEGTGHNRIDGIKEEYLTEAGLEFGLPMLGAIIYNFGKDRA